MNQRLLAARRHAAEQSALRYLASNQYRRDQVKIGQLEILGAFAMLPFLFGLALLIPT